MSIILRLIAIVELAGSFILSAFLVASGPNCAALLSNAQSYNACMERGPVGGIIMVAFALVAGAAVTALVLFSIARVMDQTAENGQMLRTLMARQEGAAH